MIIMNDEEIRELNIYPHKLDNDSIFTEKTGSQLFLEDIDPKQGYIWRILFRRKFIKENSITFIPGIYVQDKPFLHEACLKASKCIRTNRILNIYRRGHNQSISFSPTEKYFKDYCISIVKMWELGEKLNLSQKIRLKLQDNVSRCCSMLMTRVSHEINDFSARNRIVDFFNQISPQININNNRKQRIYFFMLRKMPHTFINIRYIYAKIYEEKIRPYFIHLFIS